uniref:Uncharacterized protein n=1 Tax=Calcidiscus leptoporus TaxID=127549 RepID=A0A7S0P177_9EUKA|mmetsp:Transcript_48080/g.111377  ORF Transcript_48080/g.111377 Transcript_48080/m.111377 type:complete len:119 (+) Transcript_48080:20-376(+)
MPESTALSAAAPVFVPVASAAKDPLQMTAGRRRVRGRSVAQKSRGESNKKQKSSRWPTHGYGIESDGDVLASTKPPLKALANAAGNSPVPPKDCLSGVPLSRSAASELALILGEGCSL